MTTATVYKRVFEMFYLQMDRNLDAEQRDTVWRVFWGSIRRDCRVFGLVRRHLRFDQSTLMKLQTWEFPDGSVVDIHLSGHVKAERGDVADRSVEKRSPGDLYFSILLEAGRRLAVEERNEHRT